MFTIYKFSSFIFCVTLFSCGPKPKKYSMNKDAVELNNRAMKLIAFIDNADSSTKAIALLEQATTIDTNYFLGHYNKLMFLSQLKQFDNAIATINKLILLRPGAHDLYLQGGFLYEQVNDTVSSKVYFTKSVTICSAVLDTMSYINSDYDMILGNKAINLVMLGEQEQANKTFKKLYDRQSDENSKNMVLSIMNKNKIQLLQLLTTTDRDAK